MQRKFKTIDINELIDADDINRTTKKGEMRNLYPAIHTKLVDGGWSAKDMVAWLAERGVKISVELFRVYLRDIDREQGYKRSATKSNAAPLCSTKEYISNSSPSGLCTTARPEKVEKTAQELMDRRFKFEVQQLGVAWYSAFPLRRIPHEVFYIQALFEDGG